MFLNIEAKMPKSPRDPLLQLGTWISAEYEKRRLEGYPMDMPTVAILVDGDIWNMYVVFCESGTLNTLTLGRDYRLRFAGPKIIGDTTSIVGVFQIMHVIKAIYKWGLEVYKPWWKEHVLKRYQVVLWSTL